MKSPQGQLTEFELLQVRKILASAAVWSLPPSTCRPGSVAAAESVRRPDGPKSPERLRCSGDTGSSPPPCAHHADQLSTEILARGKPSISYRHGIGPWGLEEPRTDPAGRLGVGAVDALGPRPAQPASPRTGGGYEKGCPSHRPLSQRARPGLFCSTVLGRLDHWSSSKQRRDAATAGSDPPQRSS